MGSGRGFCELNTDVAVTNMKKILFLSDSELNSEDEK